MAQLSRDGDELVLTLSALEKAESLHGDVRVSMKSVRAIEVLDDVIHQVHGLKFPGSRWPGRFAVGRIVGPIDTKGLGTTFAVVHHDTPRGLRIRLEGAHFDELLIGLDDPEATKAQIGGEE